MNIEKRTYYALSGGLSGLAMLYCLLVYLAGRGNVTIHTDKITTSAHCKATWFDPQTGQATEAGVFPTGNMGSSVFPEATTETFSPPASSEDAVLYLEAY